MICILVPLLCYSVPIVKVGYATERAETKQLFWAERLCFPQRHEGGNALSPGQKKTIKRTEKRNKYLKCRRIGNHLCTGGVEEDNYLQEQAVTAGAAENTSIHPFSVCSGSRFSRGGQKSFSTSSSSSWGIPRGPQARQDM